MALPCLPKLFLVFLLTWLATSLHMKERHSETQKLSSRDISPPQSNNSASSEYERLQELTTIQDIISSKIQILELTYSAPLKIATVILTPHSTPATANPKAFRNVKIEFYDGNEGFLNVAKYQDDPEASWLPVEEKATRRGGQSLTNFWKWSDLKSTVAEQMDWLSKQGVYGRYAQVIISRGRDPLGIFWCWELVDPTPGSAQREGFIPQRDSDHVVGRQALEAEGMSVPFDIANVSTATVPTNIVVA